MPKDESAQFEAQLLLDAQQDFYTYVSLVHDTDTPAIMGGKAIPAAHHQKMIDVLVDDSLGHSLIVMPRGAGKTTMVHAWLEWCLGRASLQGGNWAEQCRILFVANTATQAYKISNTIKNIIEFNEWYHAIFPKVKKYGDKWSEMEWRVKGNEKQKDPTFQAMGVTGPALGSRGTIIVLDDIADRENMQTAHTREQIRETLTNTIKPVLVPGGRFLMAATRWAWDDPVAWAMEQGWHTLYMKALTEEEDHGQRETQADDRATQATEREGSANSRVEQVEAGTSRLKSYWPERFSVEYLQREREADPRAFARQYQNEVAPDEGLVFERAWFQDRFEAVPSETIMRVDSWDTAAGQGRRRSYSVGLSGLVSSDWHLYIVNMLRGQPKYPELLEAIRMTANHNRMRMLPGEATFVIIEKKSSGHQAVQDLRIKDLPIIEWQPFGQKGSATRQEANLAASTMAQQGRVHLPTDFFCRRNGTDGWLPDFEQEVFSYPESEHDDIVDALCQMIFFVEEQKQRYQGMMMRPREPIPWGVSTEQRVLV